MKLPATIEPAAITVTVDTREQLPWDLSPMKMIGGTLPTGDYALTGPGLENLAAIERKNGIGELVANVGRDRERFERELMRLRAFPHRLLIVECSWNEVYAGEWRGKVTPQTVAASLCAWMRDGIPVCLAGNRQNAQDIAKRFLYLTARSRYRELRALASGMEEVTA